MGYYDSDEQYGPWASCSTLDNLVVISMESNLYSYLKNCHFSNKKNASYKNLITCASQHHILLIPRKKKIYYYNIACKNYRIKSCNAILFPQQ
jgi:hypothetical protein